MFIFFNVTNKTSGQIFQNLIASEMKTPVLTYFQPLNSKISVKIADWFKKTQKFLFLHVDLYIW